MSRTLRILLLVLSVLAPHPLLAGSAENPVEQWVGTTEVPNKGPDAISLTITKTDAGYAGTMTDSLGQVASELLRDVNFADGSLAFDFLLMDGTPMKMTLKVTGDKMAGEWKHPEGEVGAIVFERKKG